MSAPITRRNAMLRVGSAFATIGGAGMIGSQCVPEEAPAADIVREPSDVAPNELHRLIEASRAAERRWLDEEDDEEARRLAHEECEPAILALLSCPIVSLGELRVMLAYLRAPDGPWDHYARIDPEHAAVLFDALLPGRAGR